MRKLFDLFWEFQMHSSPEYATYVGYPGLDDRWSDSSPESIAFGRRLTHTIGTALASIDRALNERGYIVPGLGDAGDRLYGTK